MQSICTPFAIDQLIVINILGTPIYPLRPSVNWPLPVQTQHEQQLERLFLAALITDDDGYGDCDGGQLSQG